MGKISLIHGADEIALTLLAEFVNNNDFKVFVQYSNYDVPSKILPFMAISIEDAVKEKLTQLNLKIVDSPRNADFTLFISVNDEDNSDIKIANADQVENMIKSGYKVALVDLSKHFDKTETLLPILLDRDVTINSLIAYAGWNTVSNSIGTAISQSIIYLNNYNVPENLKFLNQRFLEDYFYLKDVIDTVNHALRKNGSYDTSYLDYDTEYEFATFVMRTAMAKKIADYKCTDSFREPFNIELPDRTMHLKLKDLKTEIKYSWPRTFEVKLKINELSYVELK